VHPIHTESTRHAPPKRDAGGVTASQQDGRGGELGNGAAIDDGDVLRIARRFVRSQPLLQGV